MKNLLLIVVIVLFSACGHEGTSVEPEPLKTLYFIDAPVNGVDFKCANRVGITETKEVNGTMRSGVLQCRKDTITFSLGKLILGSIESYKDGQEIRPQDLAHVPQDYIENESVIKIALLLQSLNENKENKNITITEEIKNRLEIDSLTDFSIEEVQELIRELGKTPIELNEVKKHLIRNSSISYEDSKPTISPFEVEISTSSPAGFTIGTISIDEGKSPLTSLTLSGEGADNFQLNSDGIIKLIKKISTDTTYTLKVKAENIYGYNERIISISIKEKGKYANVYLDGNIINATVKIIKLSYEGNKLIHTTSTNSKGNFNLNMNLLEDVDYKYYLYEVSGGEYIDNKGHKTKNKSILRLICTKQWIKNSTQQIRITALSEIAYDYLSIYLFNKLNSSKFHKATRGLPSILLTSDLNNDNKIDMQDIMIFNPLHHQDSLYKTLKRKNLFSLIINQLKEGNQHISTLFNSGVLKEFKGTNTFEKIGSFVYYFVPKEGTLFIYDLDNDKIISKLFIDTPTYNLLDLNNQEFFKTNLAVDQENNRVYLSNLNKKTYIIDTQDLLNPTILHKFETGITGQIEIRDNNILWINTQQFLTTTNSEYDSSDFFEEFFNSLEDNTTVVGSELEVKGSEFLVFDCSNATTPTLIKKLPSFYKISGNYSYTLDKENCGTETSTIILTTYKLTDLIKNDYNLSNYKRRYNIPSACSEELYLEDSKLYMYKYDFEKGQYLKVYNLEIRSLKLTLTYLSSFINKILDINSLKNLVYIYDNYNIVILDISKNSVYYKDTIPYKNRTTYQDINKTIPIDNLDLKFENDLLITPNKIIDFPTFKLSSIYTEIADDINYTLFEKYSN